MLTLVNIVTIIPNLAIVVRRLHDINKSGFYVLVNFIPLIGTIWFLVLILTKGDQGANQYGERTSYVLITPEVQQQYGLRKSPSSGSTALFIGLYVIMLILGISLNSAVLLTGIEKTMNPHNTRAKTTYTPPSTTLNSASVKPKEDTTKTSPVQAVAQNHDVEDSTRALQNYYQLITNKDFSNAYTYLSDQQKANLGTFEQWREGYSTTLSTTLNSVNVVSTSPNIVVYTYQLDSKDFINGKVKHQLFAGNITMVKLNSRWMIQDQDGRLISSYFE